MSEKFQSRYGNRAYNGEPNGCPDMMYPMDVDYDDGDVAATFEEFKAAAYHNVLNLPISWYFAPEDEGGEFTLIYVMPRKYNKTFSQRLAPGFDRAEVEAWLEEWTKQVARNHFGWTEA